MKVYISCDMEGISGVVAGKQTGNGEEYKRAQKLMTGEVNAAIEGALAGGATEILVNDSHGSMRNILIEELNPSAQLISGSPKPLSREAAQSALSREGKLFVVEPPITLRVDFTSSAHLDMAELIPGANRVSGRRIEFTHDDLLTVFKVWQAMLKLAQ